MSQLKEAAQQALDALTCISNLITDGHDPIFTSPIEALKVALAPPDASQSVLDALATLYRQAYRSGHHDTVEGQYTEVLYTDRKVYFADAVQDFLEDDFEADPLAMLLAGMLCAKQKANT